MKKLIFGLTLIFLCLTNECNALTYTKVGLYTVLSFFGAQVLPVSLISGHPDQNPIIPLLALSSLVVAPWLTHKILYRYTPAGQVKQAENLFKSINHELLAQIELFSKDKTNLAQLINDHFLTMELPYRAAFKQLVNIRTTLIKIFDLFDKVKHNKASPWQDLAAVNKLLITIKPEYLDAINKTLAAIKSESDYKRELLSAYGKPSLLEQLLGKIGHLTIKY